MITSIKEMHNLGRYENFIGNQEIGKQQIIFGFNGSGKSTLSDMFYSLANKKSISVDRRTLDKISGEKAGEIKVVLGTDSEEVAYSESDNWSRELEIYTFNEQYIRDYVFVNREYKQDIALVTMGAEGVKLANEKANYIQQINEHMQKINNFLSANKEICSELGLGKNKVKERLDDCFDRIKLKKINELLRELNIKFTLDVEGRQYYIKLKDYVPQKYDKEQSKICSEGEKRILAFAYFLSEIEEKQSSKIIVIDDPITSLDLSRKSVIAYRIGEMFGNNNDQVIVMTHDIAFVEQILEFSGTIKNDVSMLELKNRENVFYPLEIKDYLMSDEMVYKSFITNTIASNNESDRIIALMSLRPYTSIVNPEEYSTIEKKSTYFAHTVYAHNAKRNIKYDENMYNCQGLRKYIHDVEDATQLEVDCNSLVPDGYCFSGFEYENVKTLYLSIGLETIADARKKAMLLRVALEACLFQLTTKAKFDPERIGNEYKKVIGSCSGDKKKIAKKLKELYDLSKKYHHGADEGSTLGLSWINPDELELFDRELKEIFDWIDENCVIKMVAA